MLKKLFTNMKAFSFLDLQQNNKKKDTDPIHLTSSGPSVI